MEKTSCLWRSLYFLWKHLHARGENMRPRHLTGKQTETPPRTWRKRRKRNDKRTKRRNTSTHVEKTQQYKRQTIAQWKHLHARGENRPAAFPASRMVETPPRTWRKPFVHASQSRLCGNTSTHVEKTLSCHSCMFFCRKHLHARGENIHAPVRERL